VSIAYGAWQYYGQLQTDGDVKKISANPAPNFSLNDINGTQFSLSQHSGDVIVLHFMAVGCGGQIGPINDYQLSQLETVCNNYCGRKAVTIVSVVVATCPSSDLVQMRVNKSITWILGNDYDDGKMDIIDAYTSYRIEDGTIILVDKMLNVAQVYNEAVTADTLSFKIDQLLGA
jgi:hypothetical protein